MKQHQVSGFATRAEATAAMEDVKARQQIGVDVTRRALTVRVYLTEWLETKRDELTRNTMKGYEGYAERVWIRHLGHMKLTDIRATHILHALKASTAAGSTTRVRAKATISSAFEDAIREGLVPANPAKRVRIKGTRKTRPVVWTAAREAEWRRTGERPSVSMVWRPEHLRAFLDDQAGDPLFAVWWLMSYRGLRRGECLGLRWSRVDFEHKTVTVDLQRVKTAGEVYEQAPKSAAGNRTIPLRDEGVKVLRDHRKRQLAHTGRSEYVFTMPNGKPWDPQAVSHQFRKRFAVLGLPVTRAHDLRHMCATLLLRAGVADRVIMEVLGHSQLRLTMETYTSVLPDLLNDSLGAADAMMERRTTQS